MGITHNQIRRWINRVFDIRQTEHDLKDELRELGEKLGVGKHRSQDHPGYLVAVSLPKKSHRRGGYRTSWEGVAETLRSRYKVPHQVFKSIIEANQVRGGSKPTPPTVTAPYRVSVTKDRTKKPKKDPV